MKTVSPAAYYSAWTWPKTMKLPATWTWSQSQAKRQPYIFFSPKRKPRTSVTRLNIGSLLPSCFLDPYLSLLRLCAASPSSFPLLDDSCSSSVLLSLGSKDTLLLTSLPHSGVVRSDLMLLRSVADGSILRRALRKLCFCCIGMSSSPSSCLRANYCCHTNWGKSHEISKQYKFNATPKTSN